MYQLRLSNTEFEGNNSIYLLGVDEPGPLTLVDTGVSTPSVRADLEAGLGTYDVSVTELDQIMLTHWHHDHAGLAGELQAESDATVFIHEADAPLVEQEPSAIEALEAQQFDALTEWGIPESPRSRLIAFLERHTSLRGDPATVTRVQDGDVLTAGPYEVTVDHLPGHAAGLVGYRFEREGRTEAFLGDAVLPKYTPNVGGADIRVERPLAEYVGSLRRVIDADLVRAWPGHRGPLIDPSGRAAEIIEHHERRTARVLRALRGGGRPMTPWEVSAELFGSLQNIHILHGPGEAYAHLEHLRDADLVAHDPDGYTIEGEPTADDAVATFHQ